MSRSVMFIGDSTGVGQYRMPDYITPKGGWRGIVLDELWSRFGSDQIATVGTQLAGPAAYTPHECRGGWTITNFQDIIADILRTNPNPHWLPILLGWNDGNLAGWSVPAAATAAANLHALVRTIAMLAPSTEILVGTLWQVDSSKGYWPSSANPWVDAFNAALLTWTDVRVVDTGSAITDPVAQSFDGLHLNDDGYALVGQEWLTAWPSAPRLTPGMRPQLVGDPLRLCGDVDTAPNALMGTLAARDPAYHVVLGNCGLYLTRGGYQINGVQQLAAQFSIGGLSNDDRIADQAVILSSWHGGEGFLTFEPDTGDRYRRGSGIDGYSQEGAVALGPYLSTAQSTAFNSITCMCVYKGNLFAGTSDGKVYRWTGSVWALSRDTTKSTGGITAMVVYNDSLYVANGQDGVVETYTGATLTTVWATGFTVPTTDLGGATVTGIHSLAIHFSGNNANIWFGLAASNNLSYVGYATSSTTATVFKLIDSRIYVLTVLGSDLVVVGSNPTDRRFRIYHVDDSDTPGLSYKTAYEGNWLVSGATLNGTLYLGAGTDGQIWTWDGDNLVMYHQISTREAPYTTPLTALMVYQRGLWVGIVESGGTLGLLYHDGNQSWYRPAGGLVGTTPAALGQFAGQLYLSTAAIGAATLYATNGTYGASGNVESGLIDARLPGTDKNWDGVTVRHSALVSGQSVEVQYRTNDTGAWVSLGTSSTVGDNSAAFEFAGGVVSDLIAIKTILTGPAGGSTALQVYGVAVSYRPSPGAKREWQLSVRLEGGAADAPSTRHLELLGSTEAAPILEERSGEEIAAEIWSMVDDRVPVLFLDRTREDGQYLVEIVSFKASDALLNNHGRDVGYDQAGEIQLREVATS